MDLGERVLIKLAENGMFMSPEDLYYTLEKDATKRNTQAIKKRQQKQRSAKDAKRKKQKQLARKQQVTSDMRHNRLVKAAPKIPEHGQLELNLHSKPSPRVRVRSSAPASAPASAPKAPAVSRQLELDLAPKSALKKSLPKSKWLRNSGIAAGVGAAGLGAYALYDHYNK